MHFTDLELEFYRKEMELVEELKLITHSAEAEHRIQWGGIVVMASGTPDSLAGTYLISSHFHVV